MSALFLVLFAAAELAMGPAVEELYLRVGSPPLFSEGTGLNEAGRELVTAVREAEHVGLEPRDYQARTIERLLAKNDLIELDRRLADAMLLMAVHRSGGRRNAANLGPRRLTLGEVDALLTWAEEAIASGHPGLALSALDRKLDLVPLIDALAEYRALAVLGGWSSLDAPTQRELGVSVERRIQLLLLNIERRRAMPELESRAVVVNVAGASLSLFEPGAEELTMRVIVGRHDHKTPLFSSRITGVVLNPHWNVPRSIALEEILPEAKKSVRYLLDRKIRVFDSTGGEVDPETVDWSSVTADRFAYRFRQDPGPRNALGQIKLVLPNRFGVYLHDTPTKDLFLHAERCASHGCIRVERPIELAAAVLADPAWTAEALAAEISSGATQTIAVREPVPIHLVYFTAWIDGAGALQIRRDVYGRDKALTRALADRKRARVIMEKRSPVASSSNGRPRAARAPRCFGAVTAGTVARDRGAGRLFAPCKCMTNPVHLSSLLLLSSCVAAAAEGPRAYQISAERSEILAMVEPDLQAPFWMFTDRHVVRAKQIEGTVSVDPSDLGSCRIRVTVPANQLEVDSPELRNELGWDPLQPEDRSSIRYAIEGESMLSVEKHPRVIFRSDRCTWINGGRLSLQGILTMRGIDKPIEVELDVALERNTFQATGTFALEHEDFGMQPYANALGTIKIAPTITIVVRVVGVRSFEGDLEARLQRFSRRPVPSGSANLQG